MRGFNDTSKDFDTYAGATLRSGQRLVNVVAAENTDLVLSSFDVSRASVKGMVFEEFSALTGTDIREAQFDAPTSDLGCFRQIRGVDDFNPGVETLGVLKPIYGLKDAPRA